MFEWIDRDFFWINNKPPIFNVNHITRFYVYEGEERDYHTDSFGSYGYYQRKKQYYPSFTINGNDIPTIKCETVPEAEKILGDFIKSRPITNNLTEIKNYGKVDNKILLD
jgi:hypothetical protein